MLASRGCNHGAMAYWQLRKGDQVSQPGPSVASKFKEVRFERQTQRRSICLFNMAFWFRVVFTAGSASWLAPRVAPRRPSWASGQRRRAVARWPGPERSGSRCGAGVFISGSSQGFLFSLRFPQNTYPGLHTLSSMSSCHAWWFYTSISSGYKIHKRSPCNHSGGQYRESRHYFELGQVEQKPSAKTTSRCVLLRWLHV